MIEQDVVGGHTVTLPVFDNLNSQPTVTVTAGKFDNMIIVKMNETTCLYSYIRSTDVI